MTSINRIGWNEYRDEAWATAKNEPKTTSSIENAVSSSSNENTISSPISESFDSQLLQYVSTLPSKTKLLKADILAKFPSTRKDIQTYGWTAFKDNLWTSAHDNH